MAETDLQHEEARCAVSIVCVSNNPEVLGNCLARSVGEHLSAAPQTELIVVENSRGEFATAGDALNHGVNLARNDVCVFVHQDVYLHSLTRLEELAAILSGKSEIGLVGAIGTNRAGVLEGQIRDRTVLVGRVCEDLVDVDSVDEVLFMARRDTLVREPISADYALAWHAYAVEYGARMRRLGLRVVVGQIPLTHNSLTINLAHLEDAHLHVGRQYPEQAPMVTTCGLVGGGTRDRRRLLARHRWRYRWLRGTWWAYSARRVAGRLRVVLADIRFDIDGVLDDCGESKLTVIALEPKDGIDSGLAEPVSLDRRGRECSFDVADIQGLRGRLARRGTRESVLLTNLDTEALSRLRTLLGPDDTVIGFAESIGYWSIVGPASRGIPDPWRQPAAKPLGLHVDYLPTGG